MEVGRRAVRRREDPHAIREQCGPYLLCVRVLVLVLAMAMAVREAVAVPNLRGVSPEDEKYYQTAIISCKDHSKTFSQERLNDDFCDCVDGTDEPGTNACPEAKFYCKNLGDRPIMLFSSRVNDGICDCCDGSDEYDGKIKCSNTCRESGKQSRDKLKKKLATFKEGSIIRKRDVENAQNLRQEHEIELMQLKSDEKSLKDVVGKLKVEKEAVEKAEKQEQEEKEEREREEQERREKEKAAAKEEPQQAEEAPIQIEVPPESVKEVDTAPIDAKGEGLHHLSAAERGRVIASRWTGEDVSDILEKKADMSVHDSDVEDDDASDEETALASENDEDEDYESPHFSSSDSATSFSSESTVGEHSSWWSRLSIGSKNILRLFRLNKRPVDKSEAERIRKEYQESYSKLQAIESKISALESRTKQDFGKEGEFYLFYDRCFELKDKKYVYKLCPYKDATQVEGHSTTRLGRWVGFKEDYKEMMFKNGDKCWNGPERSLRVKMRCGTKLELRSIGEPSRCDYVAEFSTPTLCLESKVEALEQQLYAKDGPLHDEF